ncbi:phosphoketolase [Aurantimonas sp. HBX-1]|uniref:phosphoketolase family protein n=1 Tax=Aurantimonas sp. HBX-1 TaxID=2906072 RepID=UPI001F309AEE|nr:phosphoketolase family protein [Aurantimonas sp. HBX-1]UIJ73129.1 phosphoketolase family protein [Aurantimonas sp. HBX-1]
MTDHDFDRIDRYWRAANYLSVGQIYLLDNPLLREPLTTAHVKKRLLGHWGTTPGLNFVYAHLNRIIRDRDLSVLYICGPGHGGPGMVANTWLEGTYSETYPDVPQNAAGMHRLFRQFSFPGGIPSHAAPETPGSIHEGGELGYALAHAYGAVFDSPDLIAACVIGDGEAETGALAASWHSNKFLNPRVDGAVLPILHLNGYKIANPTVLGRMPHEELRSLLVGYGHEPIFVEGSEPMAMHRLMAAAFDQAFDRIAAIQQAARNGGDNERPRWPMIVLRSPKGWTGPDVVDGKMVENFWRSHQVPVSGVHDNPAHRQILEDWLRSYRPEELFAEDGSLLPDLAALVPEGDRRMGANPAANGGMLRIELDRPPVEDHAVAVPSPGGARGEATRVLGAYLRDVMVRNADARNFRLISPDEASSNRLDAVFEVTERAWMETIEPYDVHLADEGRVMEILSEHLCQGWLEGYLLTGRHGMFACYEAFVHIVDSMFNQHAKWLKVSRELEWRAPIASLNYLLSSHVWQQDHNGFSHQDPGFVDLVANKKSDVVRLYFPPDANTLLCVADHCLATYDRVNVIVAGKAPAPQWLTMDEAKRHCEAGIGSWPFACNVAAGETPDVVIAAAGDVPTIEALAAVDLLRQKLPKLRIRFVNVVDLMALQPKERHPHGIDEADFDALFTTDKPVIFAYHGYPYLIHRLTYKRANHDNFHVHGYQEEGTTTTPFDMTVLNELDRFHLAIAAVRRLPGQGGDEGRAAIRHCEERLAAHRLYVEAEGVDMPEIQDWGWPYATAADAGD